MIIPSELYDGSRFLGKNKGKIYYQRIIRKVLYLILTIGFLKQKKKKNIHTYIINKTLNLIYALDSASSRSGTTESITYTSDSRL